MSGSRNFDPPYYYNPDSFIWLTRIRIIKCHTSYPEEFLSRKCVPSSRAIRWRQRTLLICCYISSSLYLWHFLNSQSERTWSLDATVGSVATPELKLSRRPVENPADCSALRCQTNRVIYALFISKLAYVGSDTLCWCWKSTECSLYTAMHLAIEWIMSLTRSVLYIRLHSVTAWRSLQHDPKLKMMSLASLGLFTF